MRGFVRPGPCIRNRMKPAVCCHGLILCLSISCASALPFPVPCMSSNFFISSVDVSCTISRTGISCLNFAASFSATIRSPSGRN